MKVRRSAPLRLAVIGAGLGSQPHFRSLTELADEAEVAWIVGRSLDRLQAVPLPAGARATARLADALEDPSVQAVLVLTPPSTHLEFARAAALAGKHVLVEKPLEIDLPRATEPCKPASVPASSWP